MRPRKNPPYAEPARKACRCAPIQAQLGSRALHLSFLAPNLEQLFYSPFRKRCTWGRKKQAGGFPVSEAPGSALNLLQPFGKGRSSPSWQSVGTGSQIAGEGGKESGKESQPRLLSPAHPVSFRAALRSVTRPPNSRGWGWGFFFVFWKGQRKQLLPTFLSLRLR